MNRDGLGVPPLGEHALGGGSDGVGREEIDPARHRAASTTPPVAPTRS
ncbi:MAG TPA: hypothetical protein VEA78_11280 [Acidimicrobiales bacterium]|nr:hypothetical protein [Acidimicrobiales bacterium]